MYKIVVPRAVCLLTHDTLKGTKKNITLNPYGNKVQCYVSLAPMLHDALWLSVCLMSSLLHVSLFQGHLKWTTNGLLGVSTSRRFAFDQFILFAQAQIINNLILIKCNKLPLNLLTWSSVPPTRMPNVNVACYAHALIYT